MKRSRGMGWQWRGSTPGGLLQKEAASVKTAKEAKAGQEIRMRQCTAARLGGVGGDGFREKLRPDRRWMRQCTAEGLE
jgi:hypothetical protein